MKHLITKIGIAGLILMLAFACKSGNSANNDTNNNSGSTEKYIFEFNLPQGEVFKQIVSSQSKTTQEYMGEVMSSDIEMKITTSYRVKDINAGNYVIDMTYDALRIDMNYMGTKIVFDSNTNEEKAHGQNYSPVFKAITNIPIKMEMSKNGKIISVNGYKKIFDSMREAVSELDETTQEQLLTEYSKQFSEQAVKETFEQLTMYFPKNPITVGEKWNIEINNTTDPNTPVSANMELELESVKDKIAIIKGTGTATIHSDQIANENQTIVSLKGTQTATIKIDTQTGWVLNADIVQNLKGTVEVPAEGIVIPQTTVNIMKVSN